MVSNNCATYYAAPVLASTSVIHEIVKFGEKSTVSLTYYSIVLFIHCVSVNAPIWYQYIILYCHRVTNKFSL